MTRRENSLHLLEIIAVVCPQINEPARNQGLGRSFHESASDQSVFSLFSFWPRIRKVDVQRRNRASRQQIFQEVRPLNANQSHVAELQSRGFAIGFAQAA